MRLAPFIEENMEPILAAWESFAASLLPAARDLNSLQLRDHAQELLRAVVLDLSTSQTRLEQSEKSQGRGPRLSAANTAAETHAVLRARGGFDVNQLAAEYRALRASVLRLWMDHSPGEVPYTEDIIRFNEALDQALAESIEFFSQEVERSRNLLLGMLGHDMRSPLQTIRMTATYLSALNAGKEVSGSAERLIRSGARMQGLLDDLLDYTRTKFGMGIKMSLAPCDLGQILSEVSDQIRAAYPTRSIESEKNGDLRGEWDRQRLEQLLTNLLVNAIKYGSADAPVCVAATGKTDTVLLKVNNAGPAIAPAILSRIFDPLVRGTEVDAAEGSLGLGLYIVQEIAKGHGGTVSVRSNEEEGTSFIVELPRGDEAI